MTALSFARFSRSENSLLDLGPISSGPRGLYHEVHMNTWTLIQIVFDLFMACGLFVIVMRMNRAPKDDPRLSRGLQLLQSKISVLEDLSDRTEAQVSQLTAILENKLREVQAKVELADRHVNEIRVSMERSLEVAQIFQDKIPHKEIIERQNTIKYVNAARLAHQGLSVAEISEQVDLPRGELDFIASVNRDRLMFTESELPEWAKNEAPSSAPAAPESVAPSTYASAGAAFGGGAPAESQEDQSKRLRAEIELAENQRLVENLSRLQFEMQNLDQQLARESTTRDLSGAYDVPKVETDHLKKLGEQFRQAVKDGEVADARQPFGAAFQAASNAAHTVSNAGRSMLPPLENLSALIPQILEAAPAPVHAAPLRSVAATPQPQSQPVTAAPARPQDPLLARAAAAAKVQAALRASARPVQLAKPNPELQTARAMARDINGNPAPAAKPGEVRTVRFPRIDGSDT